MKWAGPRRNPGEERGVTLIEMLLVLTIISLMVGISFPAITSGVDSLRLLSASDTVVSFLNSALNRAERRQQVMEVSISKTDARLTLRSTEPGFIRETALPPGIRITRVVPDSEHVYLFPGGTVPRIGIELENQRGVKKLVRVDPVSGVPDVENIVAEEK